MRTKTARLKTMTTDTTTSTMYVDFDVSNCSSLDMTSSDVEILRLIVRTEQQTHRRLMTGLSGVARIWCEGTANETERK